MQVRMAAPPVEPRRGGTRIQSLRAWDVLSPVRQHVNERVPHFARRRKCTRMVAVAPHAATTLKDTVHPSRQADREPARTPRERPLVGCFYEQVDMVGLHREMDETKSRARAKCERAAYFEKQRLLAQAREPPHGAQGEMDGMTCLMFRPGDVRHAGVRARPFATGAFTRAAPSAKGKLALHFAGTCADIRRDRLPRCLKCVSHLDSAII